ncbi:hypothetical protein, partial [Vibrio parahaemolyticus]|uniref:hypothetical protein n=1 Tax=Vibrio parahaemolyticus TaxID=670 RepID=UPI001C5F66AD
ATETPQYRSDQFLYLTTFQGLNENIREGLSLFFYTIFHFFLGEHNAQLRGEARNTDVTVWHFNTKTNA